MKLAKITILFSFILLWSSCDEDILSDANDLQIVTGVFFFDDNGQPISKVGNPNSHTRNDGILVYPIPGNGVYQLSTSMGQIEKFWLVPASKSLSHSDHDYSNPNFDHSEIDIEEKAIQGGSINNNFASINIQGADTGYYRLIIKDSSQMFFYFNLYHDDSLTGNEILTFLLDEF